MSDGDKKYNKFKEYKGKRYTGMKIGGTHKWYYAKGEWKERKKTPEEWDVFYQTKKTRAGKAPEGSGAPVGTGYNWLIVAHQRVDKLDANNYMTHLEGKKFKVSHLSAKKGEWNIKEKTQRKKVIAFLEKMISDIKEAGEDEEIPYSVNEEKERIYGLKHMTKKELYDIARERDISGRSKLKRDELLNAIQDDMNQEEEEIPAEKMDGLSQMNKSELYDRASERDISGRSKMDRDELLDALLHDKEEEDVPYSENEELKMDGLSEMSKSELYDMAAEQEIHGRSKMKKEELLEVILSDEKQEEK